MGLSMNDNKNKIVELDLNDVLPNRFQPRIKFNEESIIELSESVKEHGVIQPIIVRPIGDKYEIVAGERRYKACVLAGLSTIPSVILDLDDRNSVEVALIENVQRKDLTPIEEAISYKKILDMGYLTQEQLAAKLGKSQSAIANKKRLLNLCDEVQEALMEEKISERHARSLLKLTDPNDQRYMLKRIVSERLTVRKLDEEIQKLLDDPNHEVEVVEDEVTPITSTEEETNNDVIDLSKLFALLPDVQEDSKPEEVKEETPIVDNSSNNIEPSISLTDKNDDDSDDAGDQKVITFESSTPLENKGENVEMINNFQNIENNYNTPISGGEPQVVSSKSFGRFFDPSYFDDDIADQSSVSSPSDFNFNNSTNASTNIFGVDTSTPTTEVTPTPTPATSQPVPVDHIFNQPSPDSDTTPTTNNSQSSMFPNLMQNQDQGSNEVIDAQTFNDFLDPTIVDGQKQTVEPVNKNVIDSNVFAKFLDPDYDMTEYNKAQEEKEKKEPEVIPSMSFAQYLSSDKPVEEIAEESKNNSMYQTLSEYSAQREEVAPVIAQEPKPDLLAPMSSSMSFNPEPTPSSSPTSVFNTPSLTPDVSFNTPEPKEEEVSQQEEPVIEEPEVPAFITASEPKPDYSMPTTPIIENVDMSKLLSPEVPITPKETEPVPSEFNNQMNSFEQPSSTSYEPQDVSVPNIETPAPVQYQAPTQYDVPSTPSVQSEPETIASPMNQQPIIVTDYNKQYDPVLPNQVKSVAPRADLRQVIDMIRSLNDQIEALGFTIDTEEYDLEDMYQVIFKINKV